MEERGQGCDHSGRQHGQCWGGCHRRSRDHGAQPGATAPALTLASCKVASKRRKILKEEKGCQEKIL